MLDLRRKVSDRVTAGRVYPYTRVIIHRRIRQEHQLIACVEMLEVAGPIAEDRSVHGRPKLRRAMGREWRWRTLAHSGSEASSGARAVRLADGGRRTKAGII